MLGLPWRAVLAGQVCDVNYILMSGDKDLEPLEQAPQLGGLGARISDAHLCADADLLKALEQGRMEGECQKPRGCVEAPEWSKAALMAPLPGSFEFVA